MTLIFLFTDIPSNLAEAEKLLSQHQTIKEEIDNYRDEYAKMMEYGEKITAVSVPHYIPLNYLIFRSAGTAHDSMVIIYVYTINILGAFHTRRSAIHVLARAPKGSTRRLG